MKVESNPASSLCFYRFIGLITTSHLPLSLVFLNLIFIIVIVQPQLRQSNFTAISNDPKITHQSQIEEFDKNIYTIMNLVNTCTSLSDKSASLIWSKCFFCKVMHSPNNCNEKDLLKNLGQCEILACDGQLFYCHVKTHLLLVIAIPTQFRMLFT